MAFGGAPWLRSETPGYFSEREGIQAYLVLISLSGTGAWLSRTSTAMRVFGYFPEYQDDPGRR
jgi:hypothetical protein